MLEGQVSSAVTGGIRKEVVSANGHSLDHHLTSRGAVRDQHLFSATHQLAIDQLISQFQRETLQAAGVAEHLKTGGVALLEHHRISLIGVGRAAQRHVRWRVVDAGELERDGGDLAHGAVQRECTAATGGLVQHAVVVEVDSDRLRRSVAVRLIGHACTSAHRLSEAAGTQQRTVSGSSASGARACQLHLEVDQDSGLRQQLLRLAEIRPDQFTANGVSLKRRHLDIANQDRVATYKRGRISPVGNFQFSQQQLAARKQRHGLRPDEIFQSIVAGSACSQIRD